MMNDEPLIVGKSYYIRDESNNGYVGIGIFEQANPPDYPDGTFAFKLL
jgi:hypothetical protein